MAGIVADWNNAAERLYGFSATEMIGKPVSILIPPHHATDFDEIMKVLKTGTPVKHHETVWQGKNGTPAEISLTVSPFRNPDGRTVGASIIAHDISDRNRQEAVLR